MKYERKAVPREELLRTVESYARTGSLHATAREMGLDRGAIRKRLQRAKEQGISTPEQEIATLHGINPECDLTHPVPSPLVLKGTSTLYDADGKARMQWVKTRVDQERVEAAMRAAIEAMAENIPRVEPISPPRAVVDTLCNLYTLTDVHIGMRAWKPETGADWDLHIAERVLCGAFDQLIAGAPQAKVAVVNQGGDALHFDSLSAVTPTNNHLLDADGRYSKVVKSAVRIFRHMIDRALQKHEQVVVLMQEGNHDLASSVWLRHLFGLLYEQEPRVKVIDSEMPYVVHEHGKTMLAFHHGHLAKNDRLPLLFASQYPEVWGRTTKRYCHVGHRHHVEDKEHPGMRVVQHPTIAARDAYAARGGWISERQMTAFTYHKEYGQVASNTVAPEMLEAQE